MRYATTNEMREGLMKPLLWPDSTPIEIGDRVTVYGVAQATYSYSPDYRSSTRNLTPEPITPRQAWIVGAFRRREGTLTYQDSSTWSTFKATRNRTVILWRDRFNGPQKQSFLDQLEKITNE